MTPKFVNMYYTSYLINEISYVVYFGIFGVFRWKNHVKSRLLRLKFGILVVYFATW